MKIVFRFNNQSRIIPSNIKTLIFGINQNDKPCCSSKSSSLKLQLAEIDIPQTSGATKWRLRCLGSLDGQTVGFTRDELREVLAVGNSYDLDFGQEASLQSARFTLTQEEDR